ncbi:MAG: hypothetical protein AAFR47_17955 [Pseudomonadota bacterium]
MKPMFVSVRLLIMQAIEKLPDRRALPRKGRAMVEFYCARFSRAPLYIKLDIDDNFYAAYGGQSSALMPVACGVDARSLKYTTPAAVG